MWIDCPMCGKENAAWEDSEVSTFCGECEEKYHREMAEQERTDEINNDLVGD